MSAFIPVNEPLLGEREQQLLGECISSGWISSEGPFVRQLEEGFARRIGRRFGVAVCNGSAALDAAVAALRLGPGDEVILPTFTIISCAAAVVRAGATPVMVDADPATWNLDVQQLEARVTSRTRAIMVVHIYGLPVDMQPVLRLAAKHDLALIEDAAEAHGLSYGERACGSFGELSTFSFYPNKLVTTGEGGLVATDDGHLAERLRSLRNLCFGSRRFVHEELGWNFRMSNLQAAVGVAQLERLDAAVARKRTIGRLYAELLADLAPRIQLPLAKTSYAKNTYWVYGVVLGDEVPFDAQEVMVRLRARGVGSRPFFWPMHEQPALLQRGLFQGERHPVAERMARRGLYLPGGLTLSDEQVARAAAALREALA